MKVTAQWIAEQCGVSRGTVDRVVNGRPNVAPEVRERVQKIISEYGYKTPSQRQAARAGHGAFRIGVILPSWDAFFIRRVQPRSGVGVDSAELAQHRFAALLPQLREIGAAREDLVHVALVGDIENETVTWRTEHAVQRHGKLHHAKIRTDVATMLPAVIQQRGTNLQTQITQLLRRKGMHIRRRMNRTQYASGHYAQLSFPEPVFFTAENPIPLYASAGVSVVKYLQSLLNCGTMETMK
mgnify:CR=1 FL=1